MTLLATLRAMRKRGGRKPARFQLRYAPPGEAAVAVGYLEFDGDIWTFSYNEAYKHRSDLRPIEGFDELDTRYRSPVLFPFFAVRIPDADRPDVRRRLDAERLRDPEPTDLLRMFGRRVVSSPAFELVPA